MKRILTNAVLITTIGLVGCTSNNTQMQKASAGTVVGGVAGGLAGSLVGAGTGQLIAVGTGAVIGALIGNAIGQSMDSTDNMKTYHAMQENKTNQTSQWENPHTHVQYTMEPTSGYFTVHGNSKCRNFYFSAVSHVHGKTHYHHEQHAFQGTACYRDDGMWYLVR